MPKIKESIKSGRFIRTAAILVSTSVVYYQAGLLCGMLCILVLCAGVTMPVDNEC